MILSKLWLTLVRLTGKPPWKQSWHIDETSPKFISHVVILTLSLHDTSMLRDMLELRSLELSKLPFLRCLMVPAETWNGMAEGKGSLPWSFPSTDRISKDKVSWEGVKGGLIQIQHKNFTLNWLLKCETSTQRKSFLLFHSTRRLSSFFPHSERIPSQHALRKERIFRHIHLTSSQHFSLSLPSQMGTLCYWVLIYNEHLLSLVCDINK